MSELHEVYFLLGSYLQNPQKQLFTASSIIEQKIGTIINRSNIYLTAAWGNINQPDFLNQVLKVSTLLNAEDCLEIILEIETRMGRIRTIRNAPRTIDIDILFYDNLVLNKTNLTIPHPYIAERMFVLVPMNQIAPGFIHPLFNKSIAELINICPDKLNVSKM